MRYFLLILFLVKTVAITAQNSDIILLKKNNKTIQSYYEGQQIAFVTVHGVYKNAVISKIKNDSLFLQEFDVRPMTTQFGFYIIDTLGSYSSVYPYKDIKKIIKQRKGFDLAASGSVLLGGGMLIAVISGVVFLVSPDKFSPFLLGAAVALGVTGYFLSKKANKEIEIGRKKYELVYLNMQQVSTNQKKLNDKP